MSRVTQEGLQELEEFLNDELSDYSQFKWKIEVEDAEENIFLVIFSQSFQDYARQHVRFSYCEDADNIKQYGNPKELWVELGEDYWYIVNRYNSSIKYFWQALLCWEW